MKPCSKIIFLYGSVSFLLNWITNIKKFFLIFAENIYNFLVIIF